MFEIDGRKYVIQREPVPYSSDWMGVGVEVTIDSKPRRHAVEFRGKFTDGELFAKAKPILDAWEAEERAKGKRKKTEKMQ